jgi:hypothetical protein
MTVPFRMPYARCLPPVCAAVLAAVLTGCAGGPAPDPSTGGDASGTAAAATGSSESPEPAEETGSSVPETPATGSPAAGNDVAPYGDVATRDAVAAFGSTQQVTDSLEAVVEGPRPEVTGDRPVRAAPGSPVQVFTLTLTNTGTEPVDAMPWSFPVAVAGDVPATPAFDESLGVRMETFSTLAPGESAALDVAFSAPHDADLAVRVFDNTEPDHYVAFTD